MYSLRTLLTPSTYIFDIYLFFAANHSLKKLA